MASSNIHSNLHSAYFNSGANGIGTNQSADVARPNKTPPKDVASKAEQERVTLSGTTPEKHQRQKHLSGLYTDLGNATPKIKDVTTTRESSQIKTSAVDLTANGVSSSSEIKSASKALSSLAIFDQIAHYDDASIIDSYA